MTTNHTSVISAYIAHGWALCPIPGGTKGPRAPGWNTRACALTASTPLPEGHGVGLLHAYSGTMALDIDDWAATKAFGVDVDTLYAAHDAVTILSGRPGRGKLLYRMPGIVLPSKQIKVDGKLAFELRCATTDGKSVQDVLPPSIHPDTNAPYQWGGAGQWWNLPVVPNLILNIWEEAVKDIRLVQVDGVDASWEQIHEALAHINPDCSREEWINVGMALHWAGEQTMNSDQAFALWDGWSKNGTKYKYREMPSQWASFRTNKKVSVTVGTIFHLARQNGWVRPVPDAATLFSDLTKMVKPEDIIGTLRPQPPDIDLSLWPRPLVQRAEEVSKSVGCDPIVPLWAGLGAICGVVDAQTRLELRPGFKVPPILWLMTIGDPGDRKSPGSRPMLAPLKGIELSDRARYQQELLTWEVNETVYAKAKKALLDFAGSAEFSLGAEAPPVPPQPQQPVPLKITVSDITSQKLVRQAADRPRGLLCYLDEMNAWTAKITNPSSGEDRSAWVVGYEGERYEMDRVGAGAVHCDNFALSIYGNMQPQVLEENFTKLAQDGLLQRFLPAVLRHDQTRMGEPVPEWMTSAGAWESMLRMTFAMPPVDYRLSPDAYQVFRKFQEWYEDRMKSERLIRSSNEFITAFGKITGLAGRLALVFHIIESPFTPVVSGELMERVIKIIRGYVVPAYRYVFDGTGSMSTFDNWVLEYIIQHADLPRVTMSDIRTSARRSFQKAGVKSNFDQREWVSSAMSVLEKMSWVARIDDGSKEHIGHIEWLINPHLKTMFKDYRDAVVRAKFERNQDRIERAGSSRVPYTHGMEEYDQ